MRQKNTYKGGDGEKVAICLVFLQRADCGRDRVGELMLLLHREMAFANTNIDGADVLAAMDE